MEVKDLEKIQNLKKLDRLRENSLKHRLAMAFIYENPQKYLIPEEFHLYEEKLAQERKKFDHLDLSGPYRVEKVEDMWYVVGHNKVSAPVFTFEAAIRLLLTKELVLKSR